MKLKDHEYQCLTSDPCVYIQRDNSDFGVLAVWVDNSLLFASTDQMTDHMKDALSSEWEVTDLGEPHRSNVYQQLHFYFSTEIY